MKKVAVVGFGFMGMTHTQSILKNENLQLVAIVDKDVEGIESKLQDDSGNFSTGDIDVEVINSIKKYSTLTECLQFEELDAVHVCVHTDLHYEIAKEALMHGKHVFLEKPICLDVRQGEELINLAKEKELILMVAHVVRFMPPYQKLKKWIDNEEFGKLKFLSLSRFSGVPAWGQWKEKQAAFGSSGGALFDLVIHDIDYVNYVLGNPGSIKCNYLPGYLSKHDYLSALWSYPEQGVEVKVEGGNTFHSNFPFQAGFSAQFENASVLFTTFKADVISIATNEEVKEIPAGDAGEGFYNEIAYFASCIENNTQPLECTPESSLQTINLCYDHL
jgi:predicted dehydrogenase